MEYRLQSMYNHLVKGEPRQLYLPSILFSLKQTRWIPRKMQKFARFSKQGSAQNAKFAAKQNLRALIFQFRWKPCTVHTTENKLITNALFKP